MVTLSQRLREEGRQQGLREAREEIRKERLQEGIVEGWSNTLRRQLEKRFGPLSASFLKRMDHPTIEQLEQWTDRVLTAHELKDVFEP